MFFPQKPPTSRCPPEFCFRFQPPFFGGEKLNITGSRAAHNDGFIYLEFGDVWGGLDPWIFFRICKMSAHIGWVFFVNFGTHFTHNFGRSRYSKPCPNKEGQLGDSSKFWATQPV